MTYGPVYAGIAFTVEQTGGGCEALVAHVEGGTIAMADGNGGTDFDWQQTTGETIWAGFYPGDAWTGGESSHEGEGATPEAAVEALLRKVAGR